MTRPENGPEFPLNELISWLGTLQMRYENGGDVTARRSGHGLAIFQDGKFRAVIDLDDDRPFPIFADTDA